jgi:oligopeptide transport system permease protein
MSAGATKTEEKAVQQGVSLWADAWRRLKKNTMAMVGLWVVVVMSALSALAPWISPFDATYEYPWIRAQAPGYSHPDVLVKNELRVGHAADVPESYGSAEKLRFEVQPVKETKYTLDLFRGKVETVTPTGRFAVDELDATGEGHYLVLKKGSSREDLGPGVIRPGDAAWEAFGDADRVILFHAVLQGDKQVIEATQQGGKITALTRDGQPQERIEFDGRTVLLAQAGGVEQTLTHWLGTDPKGRDLLSRTLWGGMISLLVGLVATVVSLVIGVVYGAVSGYLGGKIDLILMAIVDVLYGIPYMFLVILLMVTWGQDILVLFVALGAVQWLTMARIVRGQVLSLKEKEFVEAARMAGTGHLGIIFNHLIPNTLGVVVVYTTLTVPAVVLQESFLAFIGLTVEFQGEPLESWGALVNTGKNALGSSGQNSWVLLVPSFAMAATLFSLNFLGDGLRDALDPQQRGRT